MAASSAAYFALVFFQHATDPSTAALQAVTNLSHRSGQLAVPSGSSGVRYVVIVMATNEGVPPQESSDASTMFGSAAAGLAPTSVMRSVATERTTRVLKVV